MISSIIMGRENWNHNLWVRTKSRRDKVFRAMIRAEIGQKAIRAWHLREEKAQRVSHPNSPSCHPGPRAGISSFAASYEIPGQARDDSEGGDVPNYEWKPYGLIPQTGLALTTRTTINPGSGSPRPRSKRRWIPALFYPFQLEPSFDPPPEDDEPQSGGTDEYEPEEGDEGTQSRAPYKPDPAPP